MEKYVVELVFKFQDFKTENTKSFMKQKQCENEQIKKF